MSQENSVSELQNAGVKVMTDATVYHHPQQHYCKSLLVIAQDIPFRSHAFVINSDFHGWGCKNDNVNTINFMIFLL